MEQTSRESFGKKKSSSGKQSAISNGKRGFRGEAALQQAGISEAWLDSMLAALSAAEQGDFSVRMQAPGYGGAIDKICAKFNEVMGRNEAMASEIS